LLSGGHVILEGVPGTGKTLLVKVLAKLIRADFRRIQLTPDILPSDILGTNIFDLNTRSFTLQYGPVFTQILLADEINRTPPKTQAGLLEAMQEQQVTIDGNTLALPDLFWVVATQNSLEFEGTYPLPEAQLDRFLFKLVVDYPEADGEKQMLKNALAGFRGRVGALSVSDSVVLGLFSTLGSPTGWTTCIFSRRGLDSVGSGEEGISTLGRVRDGFSASASASASAGVASDSASFVLAALRAASRSARLASSFSRADMRLGRALLFSTSTRGDFSWTFSPCFSSWEKCFSTTARSSSVSTDMCDFAITPNSCNTSIKALLVRSCARATS